jgi:septal ring factor EnvC (AmiA/AmiB activator)
MALLAAAALPAKGWCSGSVPDYRSHTAKCNARSAQEFAVYLDQMEPEVQERFERIEATLDRITKRQERAEKRAEAADKRMDRFDKQLQATRKLVEYGMKIIVGLAKDTRELKRSQKAFLDSLRNGRNGRKQ